MSRRTRIVRRCFVIGSVGFVAIGALHTLTHILELGGDRLQRRFDTLGTIHVSGQEVSSWNLFQGTSLLMGFFSIAIGLGALGALRAAGPSSPPPVGTAAANTVALIGIIAIGAAHLGALQIWGGLFGLAMFTPALFEGVAAMKSSKAQRA